MLTVGIMGAMDIEVETLRDKLDNVSVKNIVGVDFMMGHLRGKSVVVVKCGIGKVNAAVCAQALIDLYAVDYIINTGVAGSLSTNVSIGDVVVSNDLCYHDVDVTAFGYSYGVLPAMTEPTFKADEKLISIAKASADAVCKDVKAVVGRVASGDQFIADGVTKERIVSRHGALCVEMEGAAIAHVCTLNRVPFVVIRAISDEADKAANMSFEEFVQMAAKRSASLVEAMIEKI
jgi:adenosylhomocysteine nucleosidase